MARMVVLLVILAVVLVMRWLIGQTILQAEDPTPHGDDRPAEDQEPIRPSLTASRFP